MKRNNYHFRGQVYSKKEWLALMAAIFMRGREQTSDSVNSEYLRETFIKNATTQTFIRLLLPAILFSLIGIITIIGILIFPITDESKIMLTFFAFVLFLLGIINLKRGLIDQIKIVALTRGKHFIHTQISYSRYLEMIKK